MSSLSRRHLMTAAAGIAAAASMPRTVFAQAAPAPAAPAPATGPFVLPPLTYATTVFEPHIDAKTMEIHHDKHHAAYVANMNTVAKTNPQLGTTPIENILGNINALDDSIKFTVRNNLGGHANHTMFWEIMGPNGGKPEGEVLAAITSDLGGMEKFQTDSMPRADASSVPVGCSLRSRRPANSPLRRGRIRTPPSWTASVC